MYMSYVIATNENKTKIEAKVNVGILVLSSLSFIGTWLCFENFENRAHPTYYFENVKFFKLRCI